MSIFVSIAAYRDTELSDTIDSLVNNSTHDLTIAVIQQCHRNEYVDLQKWQSDRVKMTGEWMRPGASKGAGYARKIAMSYYKNEDFFFQIDSHTQLVRNWDSKMIEQWEQARDIEGSSKVILSQFPAGYTRDEDGIHPLVNSTKYPETPEKQYPRVNKNGFIVAHRLPRETDKPEPCLMLLAGYIFGPGDFTSLGYDENIPFWGEEFMLSVISWSMGWRIYAPSEMLIMHHYGRRGMVRAWKDISHWPIMEHESQEYQANVYQQLLGTHIHPRHREVIEKFLKLRGQIKESSYTEQDIFNTVTVTREVINGVPQAEQSFKDNITSNS